MWSGFSSEIETTCPARRGHTLLWVACGAASRLRLKLATFLRSGRVLLCRMWSGFSSEIETMGEYGMKPGL